MTPREIQAALGDMCRSLGPKADAMLYINESRGPAITASVYPFGSLNGRRDGYLNVTGDDFAKVIADLRAKAAEFTAKYHVEINRKLALAIIRITTEVGACSDAALREAPERFDPEEIKKFGAAACEVANEMAAKGPFEIVTVKSANGAPADEDARPPLH